MNIIPIVLKLIGGFRLSRVARVIANGLPVTQSMGLPGLGGLLSGVLGGSGLAGILQNPIGAALGLVQGAVGNVVGNLQGLVDAAVAAAGEPPAPAPGDPPPEPLPTGPIGAIPDAADLVPVIDKLNDALTPALSAMQDLTDRLSGVTGVIDMQDGFMDVMHHAEALAEFAGPTPPPTIGMDKVLAPFSLKSHLQDEVHAFIEGLPDRLLEGDITCAEAVEQIDAHVASIQGAMTASTTALATVRDAQQPIATVSAVAASLVSGPLSVQGFLSDIIHPDARDAIQGAVNGYLEYAMPERLMEITEEETLPS